MTDTTHAPGCWSWGPRHYGCALREIQALRAEVEVWKASLRELDGRAQHDEDLLRQVLEALKGMEKSNALLERV